jgi:Zn-dependent protease
MMDTLIWGLAWYVVFVISVTFHEAAHAWMAKRTGDMTAYAGGQVSLNPYPHIRREPWGMLVLPLIAAFLIGWPFGYASTPYSAEWAHQHPKKAAWMGCMGPLANLALALFSVLVIKAGIAGGVFLQPYSVGMRHLVDPASPGFWSGVSIFISLLFSMNLILLVLNIIPLPPLDGSNIVALFLPDEAARQYNRFMHNPIFGFVGLFLAWYLFSPLFKFVFPGVINLIFWGSQYG